jgi:hypothetical protein
MYFIVYHRNINLVGLTVCADAEATAADSDGGGARGAGLPHAHVPPPLHPLQAHTWQVIYCTVQSQEGILKY